MYVCTHRIYALYFGDYVLHLKFAKISRNDQLCA